MNAHIQDIILKKSTFGYSYDQIILDENGKPKDYIFIDTNTVFEEMLGLEPGTVAGKRLSEVVPEVLHDSFNWVECFGKVALTGKSTELEAYSVALKKMVSFICFLPKNRVLCGDLVRYHQSEEYRTGIAQEQGRTPGIYR